MTFSVNGKLGFDPDLRETIPGFPVLDTTIGDDGFMYVFVQANGAIAASQTDVAVTSAGQASDGAGAFVNTIAFVDDEYGWVRSGTQIFATT